VVSACRQSGGSKQTADAAINERLVFDTSKIVILPIDSSNHWVFKDAIPMQLTNRDLQAVNTILNNCINAHNSKQDTTKEFSEFIDLNKYKLQYTPFKTSNGDRKVYVNSFCISDWGFEFNYWKTSLVEVDDGGSCFFHLTINLTTNKYEEFYTNGYA
jgi:hypothetical protein